MIVRRQRVFVLLAGMAAAAVAPGGCAMDGRGDVVGPTTAPAGWVTSYAEAARLSRGSGKLILANFGGSDWCKWCQRLRAEVYETREFREWAAMNVILLDLDFPNDKPMEEATRQQNRQLLRKYGVMAFPTILFLTGNGEVVGRASYVMGGPRAWIADAQRVVDRAGVVTPPRKPGGPADIVLSLAFDEGHGRTTRDVSGCRYDARVERAWWVAGHSGKALWFPGSGGRVSVGPSDGLELTEAVSVLCWVKRAGAGRNDPLVAKCKEPPDGTCNFKFVIQSDNTLAFRFHRDTWRGATSKARLTDTNWHHLAVTFDGRQIAFYIDGKLDRRVDCKGPMVAAGEGVQIGQDRTARPMEYFRGTIDDVRVYAGAVGSDFIRTIATKPAK